MARSLYVTAMGPSSGKSAVTLGLMELLTRAVSPVGFFRPVVRATGRPDSDIEVVRSRYATEQPYEASYGLTSDEVRALLSGDEGMARALETIFGRFKALEEQCAFVLCEGSDFTGASAPLEFDLNAQIAHHLGSPLVVVVSGHGRTVDEIVGSIDLAYENLASHQDTIVAVIANRVDPDELTSLRQRIDEVVAPHLTFAIPEDPLLPAPTLSELATALGAERLLGEPESFDRIARDVKVAAMNLPALLTHLVDDVVLLTPGDRSDVIVGAAAARQADRVPNPAGLILTGGLTPSSEVLELVRGLGATPLPVLTVATDTFDTAVAVTKVESAIQPGDTRKIAAALRLFEEHVDARQLEERIDVVRSTTVTPLMFEYELIERAKSRRRHIVLPEGEEDRILVAADQLVRRNVCELTLLGRVDVVRRRVSDLGLDVGPATIVDPATSDWMGEFAETYRQLRAHKGTTLERAADLMHDVSYFGTMMVHLGLADGMVSGAVHSTAHTIRPALEFVKTRPGTSTVSSVFFMCLPDKVLVYGDCAIIPNPTAEQLAEIATASADTAAQFGVDPYVAMLSYSTGESGSGEDVDKVRQATALARARRPDLPIEGPIQYDAAIDPSVAATKMSTSEVAGRATVLIFPDLNTGNNTYKAVQRSAGAVAVGPVLQGLRKPVNDLSRGATVRDIVNTVAITAIQAQADGTQEPPP